MTGTSRLGRCLNHGRCRLADAGLPIPVAPDAGFACPECGSELVPHGLPPKKVDPGQKLPVPRQLLAALVALVLLVGIGIWFGLFRDLGAVAVPPLPGGKGGIYAPPAVVRTGTSAVTYDQLAPALWRGFLADGTCPAPIVTVDDSRTRVACPDAPAPGAATPATTVLIARPDTAAAAAATATQNFDLMLTTGFLPDAAATADAAPVHGQPIALDALAVIVHPSNPLRRLSEARLAAIFLGLTRNFGGVGGAPGPIHVVAPMGSPAADDRLRAIVPRWLPLAIGTQRLPGSEAVARAVLADRNAIGLVEARFTGGARVLAIGPDAGRASLPTPLALVSGDYALARPVFVQRFNRSEPAIESAFADFARSPVAAPIIAAARFEPLRFAVMPAGPGAREAAPNPADPYALRTAGADRFAADLHFAPNSDALLPRTGHDLDRVAARLLGERVAGDRITIIGFADPAAGDAALRRSEALARRIATALGERGLRVGGSTGVGAASALAEPGDPRNHRVEIWVRRKPA